METFVSLMALVLVTIGWHFLFDFGWWQSIFLAFLWMALLSGIIELGLHLRRIAQHLGIGRDQNN